MSVMVVEVVNASPIEHASGAFGKIKLIFEALISSLSELEDIPIIKIEYFLAKSINFLIHYYFLNLILQLMHLSL